MINKELIDFLLEAKRNTYASKKNEVEPSRDGSIDYEYKKGEFKYRDSYVGTKYFSGQEIVWFKDVPHWSMNYVGRVFDDNFSGDFLKNALKNVTDTMPYRGPKKYEEDDYVYICDADGDLDWFEGREIIFYKNKEIYELRFHGEILK